MAWIESLTLETWLLSVFAGNPEIFAIISLIVITSIAAMFRMNTLGLFSIIGIFLIIFTGFIDSGLLTFILIIGGLVLGYVFVRLAVD